MPNPIELVPSSLKTPLWSEVKQQIIAPVIYSSDKRTPVRVTFEFWRPNRLKQTQLSILLTKLWLNGKCAMFFWRVYHQSSGYTSRGSVCSSFDSALDCPGWRASQWVKLLFINFSIHQLCRSLKTVWQVMTLLISHLGTVKHYGNAWLSLA